MALINKLKAIGDGFRSSRGTDQKYTLDEMAVLAAEPEAPPAYGVTLTDKLTALADGFRLSRGTTQLYTLDEMAVLAAEVLKPPSRLPDGYTELEYIGATGTQYINTGVIATPKTTAKYKFAMHSVSRYGGHVLSGVNYFFPFFRGLSDYKFLFNRGGESVFDFTGQIGVAYEVNAFENDKIIINEVDCGTFSTSSATNDTKSLYLMAYGGDPSNTSYTMNGKIYYCQIFEDGVLIRDFIPARRNDDSVIGLYDLANDVFYTNDGTGSFDTNTTVAIPYVESNGTQYIDLNYVAKANTKIELSCRVIRNSQRDYEALFGTRYQGYETYAYGLFTRFGGQDIPVYNRSGAETQGENFIYDEDITLVCHNATATWSTNNGVSGSVTTTGNITETMYTMFLFDLNNARYYSGHNPGNSNSVMRVYDLKIYEDDDVLVRHYVPALDADGVPCLYEKNLCNTHYPLSGDALTIPS